MTVTSDQPDTELLRHALKTIITFLDARMEQAPNRELADLTNGLQVILEGLDK